VRKVEVGRTLNANAEALAQKLHQFIQHGTIDAVQNHVNQAENPRVCTPSDPILKREQYKCERPGVVIAIQPELQGKIAFTLCVMRKWRPR